ncbi:uncharacterized protein LOC142235525 [Haematobia irritans]|uniref:uncharacterized protein LOC142235525 n=1 Tax=Haematobia irritans TaxID=7368 RepID=UPI003F4F8628
MQTLWKLNLDWDESLPQSLHSSWMEYIQNFTSLQRFTFPRYISMTSASIQIHGFCDASLVAYGACVYVRAEVNGIVKPSLLCSKSRVSPLKTLTVPKLELSAASLLAALVDNAVKTVSPQCDVFCWSDSMVVLSWIRELPSNFNVFVSNRVSQIQSQETPMSWRYVPTELNPADILSRGATPEELLNSPLWSDGPNFLSNEISTWPGNKEFLVDLPERKRNVFLATVHTDLSIQCKYHNSFSKMQRIFAYVSEFIYPKLRGSSLELTPSDIK